MTYAEYEELERDIRKNIMHALPEFGEFKIRDVPRLTRCKLKIAEDLISTYHAGQRTFWAKLKTLLRLCNNMVSFRVAYRVLR